MQTKTVMESEDAVQYSASGARPMRPRVAVVWSVRDAVTSRAASWLASIRVRRARRAVESKAQLSAYITCAPTVPQLHLLVSVHHLLLECELLWGSKTRLSVLKQLISNISNCYIIPSNRNEHSTSETTSAGEARQTVSRVHEHICCQTVSAQVNSPL